MKKLFFLNLFLFLIISHLFFTTRVFAGEYFFEEDFETLEQWDLLNGNWDYWSIEEGGVKARISTPYKVSVLVPNDQIWGDTKEFEVSFLFRPLDTVDKTFTVGMTEDALSFYDFHFVNNQLIVEDVRDGVSIHSTRIPFQLEVDRDYLVRIIFSIEGIILVIDGEEIFMTGHNWPELRIEGKFSLRAGTGSRYPSATYFSDIKIKSLDKPIFTYFRQDDELWADEFYDHADLWSDYPSIKNWGCALTSAAMILRFYGHDQLPNGEELNPQTLNSWLREEADGYLGDGLLNWLAISRLSRVLSETNTAPKLEFTYFSGTESELEERLLDELAQQHPQIVHVYGHFFVISDYDNDFLVKDPISDINYLAAMDQKIESLRIFTPSYTDLSYLLLVLPKDLEFSIEGFNLLEVQENIVFDEESLGDNYKLFYYQQPENMSFNLFFNDFELLEEAKLFLYQKDGSLTYYDFSEISDLDSESYKSVNLEVNYFKESESDFSYQLIERTNNERLSIIKEKINKAFTEAKITFYLYYQINHLIFNIEEGKTAFKYLEKFFHFYDLDFETI